MRFVVVTLLGWDDNKPKNKNEKSRSVNRRRTEIQL